MHVVERVRPWIQTLMEAPETSERVLGYIWLVVGGLAAIIMLLLTVRYLSRPKRRERGSSNPEA